jgi:hypothetical protein
MANLTHIRHHDTEKASASAERYRMPSAQSSCDSQTSRYKETAIGAPADHPRHAANGAQLIMTGIWTAQN